MGWRPCTAGYDIDPVARRLKVNEDEASRVRAIFELYLEVGSIISTLKEIDRRDWRNKRSITRKGKERGGRHFDKSSLFKLLTNMAYIGKIRYKEEVHNGEHEPIVPVELWDRVQKLLKHNGKTGGVAVRNKFVHCSRSRALCVLRRSHDSESHHQSGNKRYRYYVCSSAQKRGWHTCPSSRIPAKQIEDFVVSQVKKIGYAPEILREVVEATKLKAKSICCNSKKKGSHWNATRRGGITRSSK